jgi:hypothetical protein
MDSNDEQLRAVQDAVSELLMPWNALRGMPMLDVSKRAIALRLARLYAREKGERPTFGTARDGGHPSTNYGRALERIFEPLGIKDGVRRPAEWALAQLTDDDLRPVSTIALLGGVFALGVRPDLLSEVLGDGPRGIHELPGSTTNALADIAEALPKGRAK